jgi:hypothetical protein
MAFLCKRLLRISEVSRRDDIAKGVNRGHGWVWGKDGGYFQKRV